MMRMAVSVGRDQLGSVGVCFGKFTKTGKFKLHITALDHLAQYAKVFDKVDKMLHGLICLTFI
jgi:60S ribosome subunit biogenesis protein NIP7